MAKPSTNGQLIHWKERNWLPERYTKEILQVQSAGDGGKSLNLNSIRQIGRYVVTRSAVPNQSRVPISLSRKRLARKCCFAACHTQTAL